MRSSTIYCPCPAGVRGEHHPALLTPAPRHHSTSQSDGSSLDSFCRSSLEPAPFLADLQGRLPERANEVGAETHARREDIHEPDPPAARPPVELPLDETRHLPANDPLAGRAQEHEVLGIARRHTFPLHGLLHHRPGRAFHPLGSRDPSGTSRPDRAENEIAPPRGRHGWGESARGTNGSPLALCSCAGWTRPGRCRAHVAVASEGEPADVWLSDY